MITVEHLTKIFPPSDVALSDVSFSVDRGEVMCIIGPSGSGKSVLLRCLNMLERPSEGRIVVDGDEVTSEGYPLVKLRQKMGMVFQQFNLFQHLTVLENVALAPRKVKGLPADEAKEMALQQLRRVGMAEHAGRMPATLSGGQQQRAAIARTLAMQPQIILFDEPLSALDATMQGEVQSVMQSLATEGMTMLIVTHKLSFARNISNMILFIKDGRLVEQGTPAQIFETPQNEVTNIFVHQIRKLVFDIENSDFDFYDMTSQIKQFCLRCSIVEMMNQVSHIVEELVLLMRRYDAPIHIEVRHSDLSRQTSVVVLHRGQTVSPLERPDADELSTMIIKGMSKDMVSEQTPEGIQLTFSL